ncbi:MAG: LysR family transcriptional regulator [Xanthobacteraceae bacterium]
MELRHLRYFVAVAEEGSLTNAAERRLHTAQPSLSRQIRDLELEVGVPLLERQARGIALTAAGRTFLDHARLALLQVDAAGEAARRAGSRRSAPSRSAFSPARNWCGCRRCCASCATNSRTSRSRWRVSHRQSLPAR